MKIKIINTVFIILTLFQSLLFSENKGLQWGDNSCYFDSSIQALSHLEQFNSSLNVNAYPGPDGLIQRSYIALIGQIYGTWLDDDTFLGSNYILGDGCTLRDLHHRIARQFPWQVGTDQNEIQQAEGEQKDADEFINFLFNKFIDPLQEEQRNTLQNLFNLDLVTITRGECGHISDRREIFTKFALPIPNQVDAVQIYNCLNDFSMEEQLRDDTDPTDINPHTNIPFDRDNRWTCGTCGEKVNAMRKNVLGRLPNYFIISLKRFQFDFTSGQTNKIYTPILFPLQLTLNTDSQFLSDELRDELREVPVTYNLIAFICHGGNFEGGHYWSYGKDRQDNWYLYNDQHVSFVGANNNLQPNDMISTIIQRGIDNNVDDFREATPYILFYEKVPQVEAPQVEVDMGDDEVGFAGCLFDYLGYANRIMLRVLGCRI